MVYAVIRADLNTHPRPETVRVVPLHTQLQQVREALQQLPEQLETLKNQFVALAQSESRLVDQFRDLMDVEARLVTLMEKAEQTKLTTHE